MTNHVGRPREYLRLDDWNKFLTNHWVGLKRDVLWIKILGAGILIAIIGKLVIDFFFGG